MDTIYHYTNANGFCGIINPHSGNISLWFTHYKFLNDKQEGNDLPQIYISVCRDMLQNKEITQEQFNSISTILFDDKSYCTYSFCTECGDTSTRLRHIDADMYLCCFCKNGDSLNMWRYYSSIEAGYAIGFTKQMIHDALQTDIFRVDDKPVMQVLLDDVIYCIEEKKDKIRNLITDIIRKQEQKGCLSNKNLRAVLSVDIPKYRFLFKHECFSSEEETRCIITIPKNPNDIKPRNTYPVLYRTRNGLLTPYISVTLPEKCLKSVIVSPTAPNEAEESLSMYLSSFHRTIPISRSSLPLRF